MLVADDEDHVEAGEDGRLEINVLAGRLEVVVAAEDGVRGREDGGARVEDGGDARFGDGDGLLLHGLMDGDAVLVAHLVELVDAYDAPVCEHHGAAFEVELAGVGVPLDGRGETGCGGAFAGRVDCYGGDLLDELEELRFCRTGVTEEKDVDVAPEFHAIGEDFLRAAEEEAGNCFLDVLVPVDGWGDATCENVVKVRSSAHFQELLLFFL